MRDESGPELLRRLEREVRRVRLARRIIIAGAAVWMPAMVAWMAGVGGEAWAGVLIPVMVAGAAAHIAALVIAAGLCASLADVDHPAAVGPLIDVARYWGAAGAPTRRALIRLLPKLAASGCALTEAQRRYLYRVLQSGEGWFGGWPGEALRVSVLRALEGIGDETALPLLERLAAGSSSPHVALAAKECLPVLSQRLENDRAATTLLRAAADPGDRDMLPRPAQGAPSAEDRVLVRPAEANVEAE